MAIVAYGLWGLFPIYWKLLGAVPALETLAHRVFWSAAFLVILLRARGATAGALAVLRDPARRRTLALSSALLALNWGLFIWAVANRRVSEASLGYYINPLLNVLLARLVLGETLRPMQVVAVGVAALGVASLAVARGALPWVSLVLAASFSVYGLLRKRAPVGALDGLAVETAFTTPLAVAYLLWLSPPFGHLSQASPLVMTLLVGSGVATALPLLAFAGAARRLRYATLGMVQYLAPTLQLACAVGLYGEPFRQEHAIAFGLIWSAIALYVADSLRQRRVPAVAS
ncbi:MAG: EamA family transporter RarD [Myxococcales bacterium]|nr:EamA family transporter RarD [Myxococcales bacterium]